MALTRVAPAGIGSTPGTGYVIGDSFLHATGLNATNGYYTGIVTAQTFRVIGDFQVDGTTTTLDTEVTSVDKLEVGANNNTVGVAITQSGTGDILNLYDGSTAVFSVKDGGNVTLGTNATYANDTANDLQVGQTSSSNSGITIGSSSQGQIAFADAGANRAGLINYNHGSDAMIFYTNGPSNERLRITSGGAVNIGSSSAVLTQTTYKLQVETATNKRISFGSAAHDDLSDEGPGIFFSRQSDGSPQISGIFGHGNTSLGLAARDSLTFHAGGTSSYSAAPERLRITSAGLVGIGTDNPDTQLQVFGSSTTGQFKIGGGNGAGNHRVYINCHETNSYIDSYGNNAYRKLRINAAPLILNDAGSGSVGIGSETPRYPLDVHGGNLLVSGSTAGNLILEDRGVGDSSRPFYVVSSDGGKFVINRSNRNASKTTTSSVNSLTLSNGGNLGLGGQTSPGSNIHIGDISANGYELRLSANALTFNRSSNSYIDQVHDTGSILFRMTSSHTEAMRINSAGEVGINNTSPQSYGSDGRNLVIGNSNSNAASGITLVSGTGGYSTLYFADGTSGTALYSGTIVYNHSDNRMDFWTNGTRKLRITSGGNLLLGRNDDYWSSRTVIQENKDGRTQVLIKNDNNHASASSCIAMNAFGNSWVLDVGSSLKNGNALTFSVDASSATPAEKLRITTDGKILTAGAASVPLTSSGGIDACCGLYSVVIGGNSGGGSNQNQRTDTGNKEGRIVSAHKTNAEEPVSIATIFNLGSENLLYFGGGSSLVNAATDIGFYTAANTTTTGGTERLRIKSDGKVLIYGSLGAGNLPLGGNAASASLQIRGANKYQGIAFGQNLSNATIGIDNTKLVYTANANPANLGGGKQAAHEWWSGSSGGGGPSKLAEMTTDGDLYLGGYPLTHSVAGGSHLKLRAGDGAWGISLGMRSSQNDYAYIGFTDMNGTENIGDIFMQRTGTSTGHMVFSTNNGSGGSENRLRIGNSGRITISPDASFAAESTNIATTIVASGGDVGGYPGINIRSTASGGGTNSMNGMSILSTDGNWSLYSNSGNVHGLGLFAGNSASSGNCGFYLRSDKKITMGPQVNNEAHSTNTCGQAVHIAGGSLGIGAVSNYSSESGTGGRHVLGWYHANAFTNKGSNTHLHLVTSLWGGSGSNSEYMMGGFHIHGYRYNTSGVSEEIIYFHNWNGGLANYSRHFHGNWNPGNSCYVSSGGYVTIKLSAGNYHGFTIDLMTFNWYPVRDIHVTSTTFNTGANL